MKITLATIALLPIIVTVQMQMQTLTDAESTFLDQLATAAAVLEQRCTGYEANGVGGVQQGAKLLGSADAAMAMIEAYDAAIKAHDAKDYDRSKFRPEVSEAAGKTTNRVLAALRRTPKVACADYGDISVEHGMLRRY
ncbi:hypothetical protein [Tardiphaga sp. 619_E2_N8_6]|uniref:hypothetical protein n=1 Tax=unclassified Tardiphaga TaxID=2631404 RepID=UPI003F25331B